MSPPSPACPKGAADFCTPGPRAHIPPELLPFRGVRPCLSFDRSPARRSRRTIWAEVAEVRTRQAHAAHELLFDEYQNLTDQMNRLIAEAEAEGVDEA